MAKKAPTRAPRGALSSGRGGKGDQDDEFDGDGKKKGSSADDAPVGDLESLTLGEYNRWIITERNWESAEECREQHIEGEQLRKARDDRHRERGQIRQQDTVEQMKEAKTKVDAHRRYNLEQGSAVKRDVMAWREAAAEAKSEWAKYASSIKQQQQAVVTTEIKDALVAEKKAKGEAVKKEVEELTRESDKLKEDALKKNQEQVAKIKKETADSVTDDAKKTFFTQRQAVAKKTEESKIVWESERKQKREEFLKKVTRLMEASRAARSAASSSRKELAAQRKRGADELKLARSALQERKAEQQVQAAAQIKEVVNERVAERFVAPDVSRKMVQHPHYSEVSSVSADITSPISREIASSPRRMRRAIGGSSGNSPALK